MKIKEKLLLIRKSLKLEQDKKNDFKKYKYTSLEQINSKLKPLLDEHNLLLSFDTSYSNDTNKITAYMLFEDVYSDETYRRQQTFNESNANADLCQNSGSTLTYIQRYMLGSLFQFTTEDDPDEKGITQQEIMNLKQIGSTLSNSDKLLILKELGVKKLEDIRDYQTALKVFNKYGESDEQ